MTTFRSRRLLPAAALAAAAAAAATLVAGCGSGGNGGYTRAPSHSETIGQPPTPGTSTTSVASTAGAPPSAGGRSSSVATFCAVVNQGLPAIQAAQTNPKGALAVYDKVARIAPAPVKSDIAYLDTALHQAFDQHKKASPQRVQIAGAHVYKYYQSNCR